MVVSFLRLDGVEIISGFICKKPFQSIFELFCLVEGGLFLNFHDNSKVVPPLYLFCVILSQDRNKFVLGVTWLLGMILHRLVSQLRVLAFETYRVGILFMSALPMLNFGSVMGMFFLGFFKLL